MKSPDEDRHRYPALRQFLRGYLHQDWKQEYESLEGAIRQFCDDADREERGRLREDWMEFTESARNQPAEEISRRLHVLGSAWQPSNSSELETITRALQRYPAE